MAQLDRTLTDPVTGARLPFLEPAASTGGAAVAIELSVEEGSSAERDVRAGEAVSPAAPRAKAALEHLQPLPLLRMLVERPLRVDFTPALRAGLLARLALR